MVGWHAEFGEGGGWRSGRTEVIVAKAYSTVAGQIGIPVRDGFKPFGESARGAHVGSERRTKRTEEHRFRLQSSRVARPERGCWHVVLRVSVTVGKKMSGRLSPNLAGGNDDQLFAA